MLGCCLNDSEWAEHSQINWRFHTINRCLPSEKLELRIKSKYWQACLAMADRPAQDRFVSTSSSLRRSVFFTENPMVAAAAAAPQPPFRVSRCLSGNNNGSGLAYSTTSKIMTSAMHTCRRVNGRSSLFDADRHRLNARQLSNRSVRISWKADREREKRLMKEPFQVSIVIIHRETLTKAFSFFLFCSRRWMADRDHWHLNVDFQWQKKRHHHSFVFRYSSTFPTHHPSEISRQPRHAHRAGMKDLSDVHSIKLKSRLCSVSRSRQKKHSENRSKAFGREGGKWD